MLWGAVKEDPVIGWGPGVEEVVVGGWGQGVGALIILLQLEWW